MAYIQALFILQFHLVRHAVTQGKLIAYFLVGFVVMAACVAAAALAWVFYLFGALWLPEQPRLMALLALNGVVMVYGVGWFWGLVMEVQRSDVIDIRKMIHFPVPLSIVNAINFVVSLVGFTSLFYMGATIGLLTGIYFNSGQGILRGLLAASTFFFLSSAWAYYLRGLLVVWMEDKRRRRLLLTVLPLFFMSIGFMPMIISNYFLDREHVDSLAGWFSSPEQMAWVEQSSRFHPGGWLALAMTRVLTGTGPYWLPLLGLALFGALGYFLGYRTTVAYGFGTMTERKHKERPARPQRPPLTARVIPLLNQETTALAQALFLNFARHPQVRTMLLAPIGLIILLAVANSRSVIYGQDLGLPVVAILWPFFMFSGIFFNLFGMDQRGFRTLILLPTPRHRILMAYHLALVPLAGGMGLAFSLFGTWYFSLSLETGIVSVLQIAQLFLNFCLAGSFVSILAPMTIGRNMMRKQHARVLIVALIMPVIIALLVLPTALCLFVAGFFSRWGIVDYPLGPLLSLAFLALTGFLYPFILRQAGDLLMVREQRILARLQKTAS